MKVQKAKEEARKTLNINLISDLEVLIELLKALKAVNFSL